MKIGYIRVSTIEQNTIRQEVLRQELGVELMYLDKASGKNTDRPELQKMLTYVRQPQSWNGNTSYSVSARASPLRKKKAFTRGADRWNAAILML